MYWPTQNLSNSVIVIEFNKIKINTKGTYLRVQDPTAATYGIYWTKIYHRWWIQVRKKPTKIIEIGEKFFKTLWKLRFKLITANRQNLGNLSLGVYVLVCVRKSTRQKNLTKNSWIYKSLRRKNKRKKLIGFYRMLFYCKGRYKR